MEIETHPVQVPARYNRRDPSRIRKEVALKAYEVYKHVYGEQEALITEDCRGGFSTGELICYLYAHTFPKQEWRQRFNEAIKGMKNL